MDNVFRVVRCRNAFQILYYFCEVINKRMFTFTKRV